MLNPSPNLSYDIVKRHFLFRWFRCYRLQDMIESDAISATLKIIRLAWAILMAPFSAGRDDRRNARRHFGATACRLCCSIADRHAHTSEGKV